jgi:hypothetical protein
MGTIFKDSSIMAGSVSRSILSFLAIFLTFSETTVGSHLSKQELAEKDPARLRTLPQSVIDIFNTNKEDKAIQNKKNKNLLWRSDAERTLHNFYESVHLLAARRNKFPVLLETQTGKMVLTVLGKNLPVPMPVYTKEKGWQDVYPSYRWQSHQYASKEYTVLINNVNRMSTFVVNHATTVQSVSLKTTPNKRVIKIEIENDSDIEEIDAEEFERPKTKINEKEDSEVSDDSKDEEFHLGNKEKLTKIPSPTISQSKAEEGEVIDIDEIDDISQLQPSKQGRLNQIVDHYTKWQRKYRDASNLTFCSKQSFGISESLANIDIQLTRAEPPLSFFEVIVLNARKADLLTLQETNKQNEIFAKERYQSLIQQDPIYNLLISQYFTDEEIKAARDKWGLGDIIFSSL